MLTQLKKEDFDKILQGYNIGKYKCYKHIWWALDNTVYFLKTDKGEFVLKIFEKSNINFIKYQIKILKYLIHERVLIPKIIKTKTKNSILTYKNKRVLTQKFIKGEHPKRFNDKLIKSIAKNFGLMSKSLLKLGIRGKPSWGKDYQFKPKKLKKGKIKNFDFKKHSDLLINDLKVIKKERLQRSVIHGDFHGSNLLVKDDKLVAIIDFDDIHEDFLAYEVAVFIAHSFIHKNRINEWQIKSFLKEYQKHIKLNQEDKKAIYCFIKHRYLSAGSWCAIKQKIHSDRSKEIEKWVLDLIWKYKEINKISLEQFLTFF